MTPVTVERWQHGIRSACQDMLAEEVPVVLEYNGIGHAVMLASPSDLEDFALGFSLSEGIIDRPGDLLELEIDPVDGGTRVALRIAGDCFARLKERRRSLAGRTGCGLCGVDSLDQVRRKLTPVAASVTIGGEALQRALRDLEPLQPRQRQTGATHAAAWLAGDGRILCIREDVGRHNALDKLIGALARQDSDFGSGALLITSRASIEMVQKAAAMGIGILAAVSAPTALAVRVAEELQLTLIGFLRPGAYVAYAHAARLT
jgi:FdhD protein